MSVTEKSFIKALATGVVLLGASSLSAYTCPQAKEYTDAFNGGADYKGITIIGSYEDVGGSGIQHDNKPPKKGEGVLLRVNSKPAWPNNSGTTASPKVSLAHYELYTIEYSQAVQFADNITIYDVDRSPGSEHYYDAVAMWYEDASGALHPMTAIAYGDGSSLVEFDTAITTQPSSPSLVATTGYSVDTSTHGGSSDIKGLVNYGKLDGISVKKLYIAYWNNYPESKPENGKEPKGFQGVRFCAPLPDNLTPPPANPSIELIKSYDGFIDSNGNGKIDVGESVNFKFIVKNTGDVALTNVTISDSLATVAGGPIASLAVGASDDSTFSATYTVTQEDYDFGAIENNATVTAKDPDGNDVTDVSDAGTDAEGNEVTDPNSTETPNPYNIITNDPNDPTSDPTTVIINPTGLVVGVIYKDLNNNGKQDAGEPGIEGVKVKVTDSRGNIYEVTTDKDGFYSQKVYPGDTTLEIITSTLPSNFTYNNENEETSTVTVPLNGVANDSDGYTPPNNSAKVKGVVYEDTNGDGTQDAGESGIEGVKVKITDSEDNEHIVVTDSEGKYSYDVPAGETEIDIDETTLPDGFEQTQGDDATTLTVPEGGEAEDIDGYKPPTSNGKLEGVVYEDTNKNGMQDPDEKGIPGVKVKIKDVDGKEYIVTTNNKGKYSKTLPVGDASTEILEDSLPTGYNHHEGTNPTTNLTVPAGDVVSDIDGYDPIDSRVKGVVFKDLNNNGKMDNGEEPIEGVVVNIIDKDGKKYTLTTDENGTYSKSVPAGKTIIVVDESTLPPLYKKGSNENPTVVDVPRGGEAEDIDGYVPPGLLVGVVYEDTNGNGQKDPDEKGIPGVEIKVTDSKGKEYILVTDKDGHYSKKVPAGTTVVDINENTLPENLTQSDGTKTTNVNVPSNGIGKDKDGFEPKDNTGKLEGVIFEDTNGNGVQEPNEKGIPGVEVKITDSQGKEYIVTTNEKGKYEQIVPEGNTTTDINETTLPQGYTQTGGEDTTTVVVPTGGVAKDIDGFQPPSNASKVKGVIYLDENGDGEQNDNEKGISGVVVKITDSSGKEYIVITDEEGKYEQIVPKGNTTIEIVESTLPEGVTQTQGDNPTTVNVPAGDEAEDVDGYKPAPDSGKVKGVIYKDLNGNGTKDSGEEPIEGVKVVVVDKDGKKYTLTTDENGTYEQIVPAGTTLVYIDESTLPKNYTQSEGDNPTTLTVPKGGEAEDIDGFKPGGLVRGVIYEDLDGDGEQDQNEKGISGVTVKITDSQGNIYEVMTDSDGSYEKSVPAGSTILEIDEDTLPNGYTQTQGDKITTVTVPVNGVAEDVDGYKPPENPAIVKGVVFEDTNGNGVKDPNEKGIPGVTIKITDSGGYEHTFTTDDEGKYKQIVPEGNTTIEIDETTLPDGFTQSAGKNPTTLKAVAGKEVADIDGFQPPSDASKVKGVIYLDENGNGKQDDNEKGIPNVKVKITDSEGKEYIVITDDEGKYKQIVNPGAVVIDIDDNTLPEDVTQTQGDDATTLTVPDGGEAEDVDGYKPNSSGKVKGVIYEDTNGNGVKDSNEKGIPGVTVKITDKDGKEYEVVTDENGTYEQVVPAGKTVIDIDETTLPEGVTQTQGDDSTIVDVPKGGEAEDIDGYQPGGAIAGTVYEDIDGDGKQNPGDKGIPGVKVKVTDSQGNEYILITDKNGNYAKKVPVGSATTEIDETTLPTDYNQTEGSKVSTLTVESNKVAEDIDGYELLKEIGKVKGVIYLDENGNGKQDDNEKGLGGVVVKITDSDGKEYEVVTDNEGKYEQVVPAGKTTVEIDETTLPENATQTEGTNSTEVDVPAGGEAEDIDGYKPAPNSGKVKGVIYEDTNGNGVKDPDEKGIPGVEVKITDKDGKEYIVVTNNDGKYEQVVPEGAVLLDINTKTLPSGVREQTEGQKETTLFVEAGKEVSDIDGFKPSKDLGKVEGVVYFDNNENGKQDPNEVGAPGVEVTVVDSEGRKYTLVTDENGRYSKEVVPGEVVVIIDHNEFDEDFVHTEGDVVNKLTVEPNKTARDVDGYKPPIDAIDDGTITIKKYEPYIIDVLDGVGSNEDVYEPDDIHIEITRQPKYGKAEVVIVNGKPKIKYTPDPDVNNVDLDFEYKIYDSKGHSDTAVVSLRIDCASSQRKDSGDSLGSFGIILTILLVLLIGYRKENKGVN